MKTNEPTDVIANGTIRLSLHLNRTPASGRVTIERLATGPQEHWYPCASFSPRDAAILMELFQAALDRLHEPESKPTGKAARTNEASPAPSATVPPRGPINPTPSPTPSPVSPAPTASPVPPHAPAVATSPNHAKPENGKPPAPSPCVAPSSRTKPAKAPTHVVANRRPARSR